jgi:hypothetical protein
VPIDDGRAGSVGGEPEQPDWQESATNPRGDVAFDHVDAGMLAAYIHGAASSVEREAINRHIVTCADCRDALSDSALAVAEESGVGQAVVPQPRPFRRRRWVIGTASGLAAAAALVLAVRVWQSGLLQGSAIRSAPDVEELVAAVASQPTRPVEGRLSAPFRYAAPPPVTRGGSAADLPPDIRIAAGRLEAAARDSMDAGTLWAAGLARLTVADYDGAVAALEEAARRTPANGAVLSDLAAAYLARGRLSSNDADLKAALLAAERALEAGPREAAALFNRSLALDALESPEALSAWQSFLDVESNSEWSTEARRRLAVIR